MKNYLYSLPENIKNEDYVVATYYIRLNKSVNVVKKAELMAVGQTVGTWVPVPGITDEMRYRHMGRVVRIIDLPPCELSTQIVQDERDYLIEIAYPTINFGNQFPMMLTTLLGNDASTSAQVKLVDINMPDSFFEAMGGPKYGINGLRKITGKAHGPLTMNMIKPCTGLSPEAGARIFYETALGGIDFIKDDELLGNTSFSRAADRVREYNKAADAAYEKTGKRTIYICNITDDASRIVDTLKEVTDAGAQAIMMSYSAVGYSMFQYISSITDLPVMGHYAVSGALSEGINSGLSSHLSEGRFPRMAGADLAMINTPYGGYPLTYSQYIKTGLQLSLPLCGMKPTMPICGGGVHPGLVEQLVADMGQDIVLAAGGAVQGHPQGAAAGARAMCAAAQAVSEGRTVEEAASDCQELRIALDTWGNRGVKYG